MAGTWQQRFEIVPSRSASIRHAWATSPEVVARHVLSYLHLQLKIMTARREAARALLSARERPHYEVQPLHLRLRRGEDGGQRPSNAALSDYQLYLAMIEPQKKLKFYEASAT